MRRTILLFAIALLGSGRLGAAPGPSECGPQLGCSDPRGCPNLRVDPRSLDTTFIQVLTFFANDCAVIEGDVLPGTRRLISFDSILPNLGPGDLAVGRPIDHLGLFQFQPCHGHYHLRGYAGYRLWAPEAYADWVQLRAANPGVCSSDLLAAHPPAARAMIAGRKEGFCVVDVEEVCQAGRPYRYDDCDLNQGISAGWSDIYTAFTEGQWIDITDVVPGTYVLEIEVNPLRLVTETNYVDNIAAKVVTIPAP
ncbi:MAG TPA: lysyl oxidase family protein [Candidatus Binatia bacterium]|nr:lysyl oxidase family protein [Candidatus Binatia bacterium]